MAATMEEDPGFMRVGWRAEEALEEFEHGGGVVG
jgi:hypothetical protein